MSRRRFCGLAAIGLLAPLLTIPLATTQPATAAPLPPGVQVPADTNPAIAGTQVKASIPTQPTFQLTAGNNNWRVSNSSLGTVAYGYGHEELAATSTLQTTARMPDYYASWAYGESTPSRVLLDSAVVAADPARGRSASWTVSRYSDGSVDVKSIGQSPPLRFTLGPRNGVTFVGGVVTTDGGGNAPTIALVTGAGTIVRFLGRAGSLQAIAGALNIGKAAVAAVPRSYSNPARSPISVRVAGAAPEYHVNDHYDALRPNTQLMVLAADGDLVPFTVGSTESTNGFTGVRQFPALSTLSAQTPTLKVSGPPPASTALLDFDWSCVTTTDSVDASDNPMGTYASAAVSLGCKPGIPRTGVDLLSLGRISVAVADRSVTPGIVRVYTAGDYDDDADGNGVWNTTAEVRAETGCTADAGSITPGSFDLRTVSGVTHLACVFKEGVNSSGLKVANYSFPTSGSAQQGSGPNWPARASGITTEQLNNTLVNVEPDTSDPGPGVPVPDSGMKRTYYYPVNYQVPFSPTIQLQFPCAELLSQKLGEGQAVDDCDISTGYTPGAKDGAGRTQIEPPTNWMSYTIAGYAMTGVRRQLVVMTAPATVAPADRTKRATGTPPAIPEDYTVDNLSTFAPVSIYYADDLTRLSTGQDVDVDTFRRYTADTSQPVFLSQVPQPSSYEVELTVDTENWEHKTDPTGFPVAVLQAPPHVGGLGQDTLFTPAMQLRYEQEEEKSTSAAFSQGWHQSVSVAAGSSFTAVKVKGSIEQETHGEYEAERELGKSVGVSKSVGFGGAFDDTTVVLRAFDVYRFPGRVTKDPTGLALGASVPYDVLRTDAAGNGLVKQVNKKLGDLAEEHPQIYGERGIFRNSIDRMLNGYAIGDPSTYFQGGTASPASILQRNGGPCKGGYEGIGQPDTYFKALNVVRRENPFLSDPPAAPSGPSVLVSEPLSVETGDDLATTIDLGKSIGSSSSLSTSSSFGFGITVGASFEFEAGLDIEVEAKAGFDLGWSTGRGTSTSMTQETSFQVINTNIPFKASEVGSWISNEGYNYQMFACKAPLGSSPVGNDVWLMGYLTDSYSPTATGGIADLSDVTAVSPRSGAPVASIPGGDTSGWESGESQGTARICDNADPDQIQLKWSQDEGTVKQYAVQVEDITSGPYNGRKRTYTMPAGFSWATPQASIAEASRPSCVAIPASELIHGHNYQWNVTVDGFVLNKVNLTNAATGNPEWAKFNARATPANAQLTLRTPRVNSDGSLQVDIIDPEGFGTLRHDVTVFDATGAKLLDTVLGGGASVRTARLGVGEYVVRVRAHNGSRDSQGRLIYSPEVTARVRVPGFQITVPPTMLRPSKAGAPFTARPGIVTPLPSSTSYQWFRDGKPIAGATRSAYRPVVADFGRALSVGVIYRRSGYVTKTLITKGVKVPLGSFTIAKKPRIAGAAKVGKKLKVKPAVIVPRPSRVTYQWLRNGKAIKRATAATYQVAKADRRKKISVQVTYRRSGYLSKTVTTRPVKVRR
ncbi:hypothetical protein FE697_017040 [Mumia zhuanghuii]|uniref:Ig-like domain-containing protein n=2 Tax=Mumia TaxID=1546255 RepID=A0ABW1QP27_9ACTN|nr:MULTISPECIES: hypothetical protein [Mumia]KAA1420651.1 hypothetical protein FE697_017040 [Mumia zhuanghuii]